MTKDKDIKTVVPALRFPEFRGIDNYSHKELGKLVDIKGRIGYRGYTTNDIVNKGEGAISLSPTNINDNGDLVFDKSTYISWEKYEESPEIMVEVGYTVLVKTASVGKTAFVKKLPEKTTINPQLVVLKPTNINNIYLSYLIAHTNVQKQISDNVGAGAIPNLSQDSISKIKTIIPNDIGEQEKIADCLGSLDDLISAVAAKIEALKDHKKGLMQQLFPADGKTTPTLRFPEFQNAGEWKITLLSDLGVTISGLTYSPDDVRDSGLLVLRSSNIKNGLIVLDDCVYVTPKINRANLAQSNDILICVRNGSVSLIGKNALIPEDMPPCTHGAFMSVFRAKNPSFVFQLFQTNIYQSQVNADLGARINSINSSQLNKYKFLVPTVPEQQKIADCLSSVDKLISAETDKLDQLKAHKKGLMQQLFPTINE